MPFQLWCVEGTFARQFFPTKLFGRKASVDHSIAQFVFCLVPICVRTEALFGPQSELDRIGKAKFLVDPVGKRAKCLHLFDNLVFTAEDMCIILRKLAHAHQAMQRAMRFIAVTATIFVNA